jgi:uncharacterized protein YndB with AHSA1/START domain
MSVDSAASSASMATVLQDGDRIGLRYERRLAHPAEKIWRALTESQHLRHWMPVDIVGARHAGADIELPFWPEHIKTYEIDEPVLTGRIEVWEPPSVFQWTWGGDVLRFELTPIATGTQLTFSTWFADPDRAAAAGAGGGYHVCLDHLARLLDGETTLALTDSDVQADADRWHRRYAEVLGTEG